MKRQHTEDDLFAIPALWRRSQWLDQAPESYAQFFSTKLALTNGSCLLKLDKPTLNCSDFFKLPSFEEPVVEHQPGLEDRTNRHREDEACAEVAEEPAEHEFWIDLDTPESKQPLYKTWDGFLSGQDQPTGPLCLSEAGPSTYDALLSWETDPLGLENFGVPLVESGTYIASLLSLAVGRESMFFIRSPESFAFEPALPSVRLSGYSFNTLKGIEKKCMDCGETFLRLRAFVQTSYTKQQGRCTVALSSALSRILQILQQQLDIESHNPRSLLQLQSTINNISSVLEPMKELMAQVAQGLSDENLLGILFKHACVMESKEAFVREIMQEILHVASLPWLEALEQWIGTKAEEGMPFTQANIGETKGFVKVQSETCIDDFGEEFQDVDFRLNLDKLPDFFPEDMAQLALETGKNLRFIKTSCPSHPLLAAHGSKSTRTLNAPEARWAYGWNEVLELEKKVAQYRKDLKALISGTPKEESITHLPSTSLSNGPLDDAIPLFGSNESQIEQMVLASMNRFMAPVTAPVSDDPFVTILKHNLGARVSPVRRDNSVAAPHPSLLPVLSFGSIISAQADVVNRESLKLLFDAHHLREHLELQRSFQLLGNGMFCARLSHALFDPELETAERQAGVARQGGIMGLRLGSRNSWPPASSELRLALMGILTESFIADHGNTSLTSSSLPNADGLPGDMSFAVRDLAPEDIEKCLNPDSLEALDFLRLAYTTPKDLRVVITPVILVQYDRIFKFLIRLLRLMYVVDQLFRVVNLRTSAWHEPGNTAYRFAREARHFVSCIAAYFLDTGVALPWQAFQEKMDQMQVELAQDDPSTSERACSPETLREYHSQTLNQIMSALFLRKRQQPVLKLLEDIFVTVLAYAKYAQLQSLGSVVEGDHTRAYSQKLYRDFKKKTQVFITVCRSLTEKTKLGSTHAADGLGDESMVSQLLLKLDISYYYTKA
ncbi:hypothetical protein NLU13_0593 [Sarocladium strictum]|uniref:Spindle pole body component n=1 Tax=Sarocladium strictum TaxID=5046 RepID=A0AA39GQ39_SARSR|nr:hypothetical protein NLU13_0593 [Sarocladium strictum]